MIIRKIKILGMLLLPVFLAATAYAVCNQSTASQADRDLWSTHGCWRDFYLWEFRAYDVREGDWRSRGYFDACNVNVEFAKHWNAAYLVTYGLSDNHDLAFHGTVDYRATAEAAGSDFHSSLNHTATDDTSVFGRFVWHPFSSNEVQTSCLLYDPALSGNANPGSRAGDFMHEGWHGWASRRLRSFGGCNGHQNGPQGACSANPCGCDYFYFHGIGAYEFGAMYQDDGTARRYHSPNQVQVEFLCDVADLSKSWVPDTVRRSARSDANRRAVTRFINGPGFSCGSPRPW